MKKAKVDAIIRQKVAEARAAGHSAGYAEGQRREREKYELLCVPPDDGTGVCIIGNKPPEHHTIRVPLDRRFVPRYDPSERFDPRCFTQNFALFALRMQQQVFGNGQRVVWYEYQFRGLG